MVLSDWMKNKSKRYYIALFFVFLFIIGYFFILNSIEQKYYKDLLGQSYENASIIDLNVKIYPTLFGNSLPSDRIVPIGSIIFVNVTILNKGPSDFCHSLLEMRICDTSMKCRDNNEGQIFEPPDSISPLKVAEKYVASFGGYIPDKEGKWKYNFELTPKYCNFYYNEKIGEKRDIFEFQVVSLDTYYQYKTNKNVENLTIIILFASIITIAFSFKEVRAYTKKLIKILTEGWFK